MKFVAIRGYFSLRSTYPDTEQNFMADKYRRQTPATIKLAFCIHRGE
jgi:hypothetical protein